MEAFVCSGHSCTSDPGRVPSVLWAHAQSLSCVPLFATPWTVACQAFLSVGFPRKEYWSGLPFPFPGDLPNPGIKPRSLALQADSFLPSHQCESVSCSVVPDSLQPHGLQSARLLCPRVSQGKNTGMGCHFLLQGIFLTQGWKLPLLYLLPCRQILYQHLPPGKSIEVTCYLK